MSLGSSVSTKEQLYTALVEGRDRSHEGLTLFGSEVGQPLRRQG